MKNIIFGEKIYFLVKNIKPLFFICAILYLLVLIISIFFDKSLSVGIFFITILSFITIWTLFKIGIKDQKVYWLFLLVILIHFFAMLLIYYNNFYPFGGGAGDQLKYHQIATELSGRFRQGEFSIQGFDRIYPDLYVPHFYPVLLAILYAITMPSIIVGTSLNVWLVAVSVIFLYLIVKEIGGSDKNAFLIGLIATMYPSYLYFSSLLLRDAIVVCFSVISIFLIIKLIKKFSWKKIIYLFLTIGITLHFRFYIGTALLLVFFISWLIFDLNKKKKIIYGLIFLVLLGFLPQIFTGQGYYGSSFVKKFIDTETITFLKETAYKSSENSENVSFGTGSTIMVKSGFDSPVNLIKNTAISVSYIILGPMPWHIKYPRHLFSLVENIPWYVALIFIYIGVSNYFKEKKYKIIFPLLFFSVIIFLSLGLYLNNFGAYMRIRVPGFLALLALADFSWLMDKTSELKLKTIINFRKMISN